MMMKEEGDAPLPIESSDGIFLLAIESSFSICTATLPIDSLFYFNDTAIDSVMMNKISWYLILDKSTS